MILVIDNYDSFTWNLVQYLGELGAEMEVHRNDALCTSEIAEKRPKGIVISPGPCTPAEAGVSVDVIRELGDSVPILGVCLGHQAIGAAFGGRIVRAARLMHGKTSPIKHSGIDIFAGLPTPLTVARYHSLVIDPETVPDQLEVIATTDEPGFETEIQAVRHRTHPIWGVQFHPESIASEHGMKLLRNFVSSI
jgi:anthranilate synthase component II